MTVHVRPRPGFTRLATARPPSPIARVLFLTLMMGGTARPEEPADEKARAEGFEAIASREAGLYTLRPADPGGAPFSLNPGPILKWTNPVVGSVSGGLYLWTAQGRPEAVAAIFQWSSPFHYRSNEFQSLSLGTFVMEREGQPVWMPSRPGVKLEPFPDAPAPADTPAQRLRQMRALAGRFTGREADHKHIERELRLLTQPIDRYAGAEGGQVDGGLFVFVQGTDPEALLLIEAGPIGGDARWRYALARMSHAHMVVSDRGREVWNVPLLRPEQAVDRREPYTKFRFEFVETAGKPEGR